MKKLFAVTLFVLICFISAYPQNQNNEDVYFCRIDKDKIILDESYKFLDSNISFEEKTNGIEKLVNKYIGKNVNEGKYYFNKYTDNLSSFTKLKTGSEFYVSTYNKIFKSKVIGYQLFDNVPMGYELSPVLENKASIKEDTAEYNNNIFICSKHSDMSKIDYKGLDDKETFKKITAFLKEFESKIVYDKDSETIDDPAEIKVFEANFLNSDRKEYAVSYRKRVAFDKYASGIYIVNEIGKIARTVVEFKTEFNYYMLLGVIDYNGDGQYELLSESGYYEGIGYELYKLNKGEYEIIASGFYWGV